ncbi:MAG TPA: hypothetical protein PLP88_01895 [Bacteroidales bacterium]|nr:hypothetical protein [Bacteroidales bacterium]
MKKLLLLTLVFGFFGLAAQAQKTGIITVNTSFKGIIEGYDHINKTQLYIDGQLAGESPQGLESIPLSFNVIASQGKHQVRVINLALYEGNWEEHTKDLNYSLDALYEGEIQLKKKLKINLVFDIEKEATIAKVK